MRSLIIIIFCTLIHNTIMAQPLLDNPDIRIFPSTTHHQVEVSTVISRLYPNSILSTAIRSNLILLPLPDPNKTNFYSYSYDGGITWSGNNNLPNNAKNGPDPLATIDADGRGYLGYLMYLNPNPQLGDMPNKYGISKTSNLNNFSIWNNQVDGCTPQNATYFNDKPWIVADNYRMSPYKNNIYGAWTKRGGNYEIFANRSTNGYVSYSADILLSDVGFGQGTSIATGINGEVYICWAKSMDADWDAESLGFAKSTNGGTIYTTSTPFNYDGIRVGAGGVNPIFNNTQVTDFPAIAVDRSCNSTRGRIFVVYPEKENGNGKAIIRVRYSDNQGSTWSAAQTVSIPNGRQNWQPAIAVDETTGAVCIIYYSLDGASGWGTNTYMAYSTNGGVSYTNLKISDASHITEIVDQTNATPIIKSGHYSAVDAYGGYAIATWSDHRPNQKWQIYSSRVDFNLPIKFYNNLATEDLLINGPLAYNKPNIRYEGGRGIIINNNNTIYTLNSGADAVFTAPQSVEWKPGFEAKAGSSFYAYIAPANTCNGAMRLSNSETEAIENTNSVQVFPNPFSSHVSFQIELQKTSQLSINIYDIQGKMIDVSVQNATIDEGIFTKEYDLSDLSKGIYFYTIRINDQVQAGKIVRM
jgi:hypothetical protein